MTRNTGHGLLILVDSKCNNHNIEIDQVIFRENYNSTTPHFQTGLGALVIMETSTSFDSCPRQTMIKVSNTVVSRNTCGGVAILSNCTTCIEISQTIFVENINSNPPGWGGNLYVSMTGYRIPTTPTHYLRISNCLFKSGMAKVGGGAYIMGRYTVDSFDDVMNETHEWISILHSHFVGNFGLYGGGLAIIIQYSQSTNELFLLNALVKTVSLESTTFTDNVAWSGSAVYSYYSF